MTLFSRIFPVYRMVSLSRQLGRPTYTELDQTNGRQSQIARWAKGFCCTCLGKTTSISFLFVVVVWFFVFYFSEGKEKQNAAPHNTTTQEPLRCSFLTALTSYRPGCVRLRIERKNTGKARLFSGRTHAGQGAAPGPEGEPLDPGMNLRTSLN